MEEAKDADDMTGCLRMKLSLHTFVGLGPILLLLCLWFSHCIKILTWSLLVCMPLCTYTIMLWLSLCMYLLCSGGGRGAQPIIDQKVVGVLSRNCVIFESTPTLTFWPKRSAIWVGVLSSEYGI